MGSKASSHYRSNLLTMVRLILSSSRAIWSTTASSLSHIWTSSSWVRPFWANVIAWLPIRSSHSRKMLCQLVKCSLTFSPTSTTEVMKTRRSKSKTSGLLEILVRTLDPMKIWTPCPKTLAVWSKLASSTLVSRTQWVLRVSSSNQSVTTLCRPCNLKPSSSCHQSGEPLEQTRTRAWFWTTQSWRLGRMTNTRTWRISLKCSNQSGRQWKILLLRLQIAIIIECLMEWSIHQHKTWNQDSRHSTSHSRRLKSIKETKTIKTTAVWFSPKWIRILIRTWKSWTMKTTKELWTSRNKV